MILNVGVSLPQVLLLCLALGLEHNKCNVAILYHLCTFQVPHQQTHLFDFFLAFVSLFAKTRSPVFRIRPFIDLWASIDVFRHGHNSNLLVRAKFSALVDDVDVVNFLCCSLVYHMPNCSEEWSSPEQSAFANQVFEKSEFMKLLRSDEVCSLLFSALDPGATKNGFKKFIFLVLSGSTRSIRWFGSKIDQINQIVRYFE